MLDYKIKIGLIPDVRDLGDFDTRMTGKTNTDKIKDAALQDFIQQGLNADKTKRFQNVSEMIQAFRKI
ncbi:MAG: hypothetical protein IKY39_00050 [Clostridia bacterium]|nr:hypothetical protein [Clostridia bacterium]